MLAILWMLNLGVKMTVKQISEKLEINIRIVYRYIDALCASGVPIISDAGHNGGYSLLNNFIRAPLRSAAFGQNEFYKSSVLK
ncbi:putative DNA-binding transcriptional regulator YafY [Paenibacillus sp. DS2015]